MSPFTCGPALLFCPADRPERFDKALERADAVILDLEDAVLPENKEEARRAIQENNLDAERVIVRVNPPQTQDFQADLAAIAATDYRTIMIAKAEDQEEIVNIPRSFDVIALCETARGVQEAPMLAALENVTALMWGAEDLVASLRGTSSRRPDGAYRPIARHARSRVLLAAGAEGKAAIDAVYLDIPNLDGLREEAEDAVASGFHATACIHPSQVETIRDAYRPAPEELAWAHSVLAAAETERGVFQFDGQMIDLPVLRHARTIISRGR